MPNDGLMRLGSLMELYSRASADLQRLRETMTGTPELLPIFEPSALHAVDAVRQEIEDEIEAVHPGNDPADVWVRLQGPRLTQGQIPISVLGKYLKDLSVANKHAVVINKRINHAGRRFIKEVDDCSEFSLLKTAHGSVRIGLTKPDPSVFVPAPPPDGQEAFPELMADTWRQAEQEADAAVAGLRLLVRAIEASEDSTQLSRLRDDVGLQSTIILLNHASVLAPSQHSPIESVEIYGPGLKRTAEMAVRLTCDTRERLTFWARALIGDQQLVRAHGKIRRVDIDKRIITARPLFIDDSDEKFDELDCKLAEDVDEDYITSILNRPVKICGTTVSGKTGGVTSIEVLDVQCDDGPA